MQENLQVAVISMDAEPSTEEPTTPLSDEKSRCGMQECQYCHPKMVYRYYL
jgi:hypothetical protein